VASPFRFDRSWQFEVTPEELWSTLAQTDRYREWWPWLREFDVVGDALSTGAQAHVLIQAPLPYQLRCVIHVDEAVPERILRTHVDGDLAGPARLELTPTVDGTEARLEWALELRAPILRSLARVARPAMAWAHDRIVERGLVQFEASALWARNAPPGWGA
jgi:hypothetical protein